ncbi:ribonuclease P protein component [Pseudolysinimonas sp.]|uniref:ribonuclease P protein component n=1 Tax=Pseudolysinimonas sp. TaxID=2680009 RepID=UPI00286D0BE1|nr:ribonuclease P protein component [Pseudolysinimonas sp.]
MLARANRVVLPADFRAAVRRGRRATTPTAVYYRLPTDPAAPARFGVIVSKAVGNAVKRNRVRRRLRALGRGRVDAGHRGEDVVIRVLPGSAQEHWDSLSADMHKVLDSPVAK